MMPMTIMICGLSEPIVEISRLNCLASVAPNDVNDHNDLWFFGTKSRMNFTRAEFHVSRMAFPGSSLETVVPNDVNDRSDVRA